MRYLLILLLLGSCSSDLRKDWRAAQCGIESCRYNVSTGELFVEDRFVDDPKDAFSIILKRSLNNDLCLVGLIVKENVVIPRDEIFKFNRDVKVDYVANINVRSNKYYKFKRGESIYLGEIEPYQYSLIGFFIKKERAIKCYDPFELLEA